MTKEKAPTVAEQPSAGGSYIRDAAGKLKLVESTKADAPAASPSSDAAPQPAAKD